MEAIGKKKYYLTTSLQQLALSIMKKDPSSPSNDKY